MAINNDLIDQLLKDYRTPEDILGQDGLLKQLTKAVLERALQVEMDHHLGYEKHDRKGYNSGNSRNGKSSKTLKGDFGEMDLEIPRDRNADFEPIIVAKHQTRFEGFSDKILSLYARGMTTRDIAEHLKEIYGVEVSAALISDLTNEVIDEVRTFQNRPLESHYAIAYLDALFIKVREGNQVFNKAFYVVIGVNLSGIKEVLGIWTAMTEGAKFWLGVMTELRNRGVKEIFIACVDGLTGLPEAIEAIFPQTQLQQCIVHLVRQSLKYVSWKDRKQVAEDLKRIYSGASREDAETKLSEFEAKWSGQYRTISQIWRRAWERVVVFLGYPAEIGRVIYTTNAIESLNSVLRKATRTRGSFPNDEAALKVLYLAIQKVSRKWTRPVRDWKAALNCFAIVFEGRLPLS